MAQRDNSAGAQSGSTAIEDLATELFALVRRHLTQFGLNTEAQREAFDRSDPNSPQPVSGGIMRDVWGLAELITEWSRAPEYLNANGQPKILKLKGPGPSFEALVNRFLPSKSVAEAVDMAQQSTEIELVPRARIALIGSIFVTAALARETLLAHTVRHVDYLLGTLTRNAALPPEDRVSKGYMERMTLGVIRKDAMADFVKQLRPQIYELLMQFDTAVEQRAPRNAEEASRSTAAAIGVYIAEEADWSRTGVDPKAITK